METSKKKILPGMMYSRKEDGKVIRVKYVTDDGAVLANVEKGSKSIQISQETLNNDYIMLVPNAFVILMVTDIDADPKDIEIQPDFYICVNKASDINAKITSPCLIFRQNIYSSLNQAKPDKTTLYMGEYEYTPDPKNAPLNHMMQYKSIDYSYQIATYVEDTASTILQYIRPSVKKKLASVLGVMYDALEMKAKLLNTKLEGAYKDLYSLFNGIRFDYGYRTIFGIYQVDWKVELENNVTADGTITLTNKQKSFIEDITNSSIKNISVTKYDPDVMIEFKRNHIMLSDNTKQMYFIEYDILKVY